MRVLIYILLLLIVSCRQDVGREKIEVHYKDLTIEIIDGSSTQKSFHICRDEAICEGIEKSLDFEFQFEEIASTPTITLNSLELQERFNLQGQGSNSVSPYGSSLEVGRNVVMEQVELKEKKALILMTREKKFSTVIIQNINNFFVLRLRANHPIGKVRIY